MNAAASSSAAEAGVQPLLDRLTREHFPSHPLSQPQPGRIVAQFFQSRLTSAFQPVVRAADASIAGHHGLLRVFDERGQAVAPWNVFARAADEAQLVQLDRLARTLHALNYFQSQESPGALFLNVEQRLLEHVAADYGAYFETILAQLGITAGRVVIVLPASAVNEPVTFVRAAISYRIRGYRVMAQVRGAREADLAHLFLADPHYVGIDVGGGGGGTEMRRLVEALTRRGIQVIARRIEDEVGAQVARDAGFGFLQGWHFDPDGPKP
jgi:EAL domain-containing protein (putative c-di-GMP-specific phosphodiesterase class I)